MRRSKSFIDKFYSYLVYGIREYGEKNSAVSQLNPGIDNIDSVVNESNIGYNSDRDFTSLIAWKKCRELKQFFYNRVLVCLPKDEKYNLDLQIRRAAISSTANIAEGYGRFYFKEGIQFYRISRASIYELKDHLISCFDLKFIDENTYNDGLAILEDAKKLISGYINFVKKKIR